MKIKTKKQKAALLELHRLRLLVERHGGVLPVCCVAKLFGVSSQAVWNWVKCGKLTSFVVFGKVWVPLDDLERFYRERMAYALSQ